MPSAPSLTLWRAPFVAALPDTCVIARYSHVSDGAGGYTDLWLPDTSAVACRVAPATLTPTEQAVGGGVALVATYTVTFAAGTGIGPQDRLVWTEPLTGTVRVLQVIAPGGRSWPLSRRVRCVEVGATA